MKDVTRRTFVKQSVATGISSGILLGLVGCSTSSETEEESAAESTTESVEESTSSAGFTPGTYTEEATGHNSVFNVEVTFDEDSIDSITAPDSMESLGLGATAFDVISNDIIDYQSLNVDSISGATVTSAALLSAVNKAADEAAATDLLESNDGPVYEVSDTYTSDIAVVGAGGAGLCAAIKAAQDGATVTIVEKIGLEGGSTNVSEGALNAVDPERQEKQGIEDSIPEFYQATIEGGHNTGTPELVHYLTDNSLDSVHWMEDLGIEFNDEVGSATGSLGERSHYPATPYGNTYIRGFQKYIEDNLSDKITIIHNTVVDSLLLEDGSIRGLTGTFSGDDEGKTVTVNAKAVIIATGGFGANVEYRQKVNTGVWKDVVLDDTIGCTNVKPCAQGLGLELAEDAGAELVGLSDIQLHPCGTPGTGLMQFIRTSGRNRLFVNTTGERFVNEGAARDTLCQAIFEQEDSTYWIVVNSVRYPDPTVEDSHGQTIDGMLALGVIEQGETVEELAQACGMDPEALQSSIDGYNEGITGEASDPVGFVADNTEDVVMTDGPWYACRKVPTVHHTMGGIKINVNTEVIDTDENIIPGLYACGEVTGGIHGENRLGGNAIADCMCFGRQAGDQAADYSMA